MPDASAHSPIDTDGDDACYSTNEDSDTGSDEDEEEDNPTPTVPHDRVRRMSTLLDNASKKENSRFHSQHMMSGANPGAHISLAAGTPHSMSSLLSQQANWKRPAALLERSGLPRRASAIPKAPVGVASVSSLRSSASQADNKRKRRQRKRRNRAIAAAHAMS